MNDHFLKFFIDKCNSSLRILIKTHINKKNSLISNQAQK